MTEKSQLNVVGWHWKAIMHKS